MMITRVSSDTGISRTLDIDVRADELTAWRCGVPPDVSLSRLSKVDREFVTTGRHPSDRDLRAPARPAPAVEPFIEHAIRLGDARRECPCCGARRSSPKRGSSHSHQHRNRGSELEAGQVPGGWKLS